VLAPTGRCGASEVALEMVYKDLDGGTYADRLTARRPVWNDPADTCDS